MQKLMITCLSLLATQGIAAPKIGEQHVLEQQLIKPDGTVVNRELTVTVVEVDKDKNEVRLLTTTPDPTKGSYESTLPIAPFNPNDLGTQGYVTAEEGQKYVENCTKIGQTLEQVTVPAGKFLTCKVVSAEDQYGAMTNWIAGVPGGVIQQDVFWKPTGNRNLFKLKNYLTK